jgi:hypothetical protein
MSKEHGDIHNTNNNDPCLSIWIRDKALNPKTIAKVDADIFHDAYGMGYSDRSRAKCKGQNVYLGKGAEKTSAQPSPVEGPSAVGGNQFFHKNYDVKLQP